MRSAKRIAERPAQLAFEQWEGYLAPTTPAPVKKPSDSPAVKNPPAPNALPRNTPGLFALRIKGDSMLEAGILDGDQVIARRQSSGINGDIVVARLGNKGTTVRRLVRKPGVIQLAPANSRYRAIPVDENVKILGKVIRVVRQYSYECEKDKDGEEYSRYV